ncbi:putative sap domain protein [Phaeomoniella chlamydospora]|uniref:Putative sap domain protein n=1 Tax=Phaeomoniella chlamydospora TaxID=158046 RepID=A0A0G2HD88_PHACM|nr:putative sap domain protein [Phaeomoniella chlamydospora]
MTDYAKKTVAELHELLKARSLPYSGKKAELVARLQENDSSRAAAVESEAAPPATTTPETVEPIPAQQPTLAKPVDPVDAPAVPAPPAPSTDPSTTTNSVPASTAPASTPSFAANLSTSTLESELEKRKARAQRFGASLDQVNEAEKVAQRAQRFGLSNGDAEEKSGVKGLDEALPERRERKFGGRGGGGGGGRGGAGFRGNGNRRRGNTPRIGEKGQVQKQSPGISEKDRAAAEARKKRFAA